MTEFTMYKDTGFDRYYIIEKSGGHGNETVYG